MTVTEAIKILRDDAQDRKSRIYFDEETKMLLEAVSCLREHCGQNANFLEKVIEIDGYVKRLKKPASLQEKYGGAEQVAVHILASLDTIERLLEKGD